MADRWLYVRFDERELEKMVADEPGRVELIRTTAPDRERPDCEVTVYSFLEIRELDDEHRAFFQVKHVPAVSVRTSVIGDETYRRVEDLWADRDASANNFQLTVDKGERTARFGPKGMIMVRPDECRGRGIGSYAFGKVVEWGKDNYPDYSPLPLELAYRDAADPENRDRRNRFYERFGFRMQYNEPESKNTGKAVIDKLGLLENPDALGKVEVLSLQDAFRGLLKEQGENEDTNRRLEKAVRELSADIESTELGVQRRNKVIGLLLLLLAAALFLRLYGYV
jgi:GNAT superfamily N-acetyltransferase